MEIEDHEPAWKNLVIINVTVTSQVTVTFRLQDVKEDYSRSDRDRVEIEDHESARKNLVILSVSIVI